MPKKTSFTYSYNNIDDTNITKSMEFKSYYTDNDNNVFSVSYKNNISGNGGTGDGNNMQESFNKMFINKHEIKEQIGMSVNKDDWELKEYHNNDLLRQYKEHYDKHPYYRYYLENKLNDILPINSNIIIEK
jgi:hypothetical protein